MSRKINLAEREASYDRGYALGSYDAQNKFEEKIDQLEATNKALRESLAEIKRYGTAPGAWDEAYRVRGLVEIATKALGDTA